MSSSASSTPRIRIKVPRRTTPTEEDEMSSGEEQEFDGGDATGGYLINESNGVNLLSTPGAPSAMTPPRSAGALSSTSSLWDGLRNKNLNFPINTECEFRQKLTQLSVMGCHLIST